MPKCPYCKEELELSVMMKQAPVDDAFRDSAMEAMEQYLEYRASAAPFGGGMMKKMGKFGLKWVRKYLDQVGMLPISLHVCKNCDTVINTSTFISLGASSGGQ